jgi:cysteine sulfinate desulfinase/cysteine desulfurase-like protein
MSTERTSELEQLVSTVTQGLRSGTLTLKEVVGLTDAEMESVAELASRQRSRGKYKEAATIYGLLLTYAPLSATYWEQMADVQERIGHIPLAVACCEIVALIRERHESLIRREARCLRKMNQPELADALLQAGVE